MKDYVFKYTKEEKIHYIYATFVNNKAKETIVVFQSAGTKVYNPEMFYKYQLGQITYKEYKNFINTQHKKLVFFKEFSNVNILFVQDNFNLCFGWYVYNNKVRIDDLVARAIKEILVEQKIKESTVSFFGSSKGGYGALIVSQYFEKYNRLIVTHPILRPIQRYQKNGSNANMFIQYYFLNRGLVNENVFEALAVEALKSQAHKLELLIGKTEEETEYILNLIKENDLRLKAFYMNMKEGDHSMYITDLKGIPSNMFNNKILPEFIQPVMADEVKVDDVDDLW